MTQFLARLRCGVSKSLSWLNTNHLQNLKLNIKELKLKPQPLVIIKETEKFLRIFFSVLPRLKGYRISPRGFEIFETQQPDQCLCLAIWRMVRETKRLSQSKDHLQTNVRCQQRRQKAVSKIKWKALYSGKQIKNLQIPDTFQTSSYVVKFRIIFTTKWIIF